MGMMEIINNFVDTMISEKEQFEKTQNAISQRERDVENVLKQLEDVETEVIEKLNNKISDYSDEGISEIFRQTSNLMFKSIKENNNKISETVKGMTFIQDFEKRFTVSVFGKVKAGKSYIGNFIMGQPFRKFGINSSYNKLDDLTVHVYDRGKLYEQNKLSTAEEAKECNGKEFYVNKSEATSTIQWINIGGMCWFDTPGIGSVTIENEELAKEYVKNSDLVIFACNSDAAGTRQEFREISELHKMNKPILLLLTQSDVYEDDLDENGDIVSILCPKSDKDRKDMEQYILDTLRKDGMEDVLKYADILTVSALLATEAIKNKDEKMFVQSNMGKLLEKLTEITRNEAADIKKKTPKTRINEMISVVSKNLTELMEMINLECSKVNESKKELVQRKDFIVQRIHSAVNIRVFELIAKTKADVEKNSNVVSGEKLSAEIDEIVSKETYRICMEESIGSLNNIPDFNLDLTGIGDMKMRQDVITYEHHRVCKVERGPKNLWEDFMINVCSRKYYKTEMVTETKQSIFDIGVNDSEISGNIMLKLHSVFTSIVDKYIDGLTKSYYNPVEELQKRTAEEITKTIAELNKLRM